MANRNKRKLDDPVDFIAEQYPDDISEVGNGPCPASEMHESNVVSGSNYKKIHVDDAACFEMDTTEEGARALTNPELIKRSSKDPNRNLYPRLPSLGAGFQKASLQLNPEKQIFDQAGPSKHGGHGRDGTQKRSPKKTTYTQSNNLTKYFPKQTNTTPPSSPQKSVSSNPSSPVKHVKMNSPIKKYAGNIYEMDNSHYTVGAQPAALAIKRGSSFLDGYTSAQNNCTASKAQANKGKSRNAIKRKKPEPTFNRDNAFLYSNDPIPRTSSKSDEYTKTFGLLGAGSSDCMTVSDEEDGFIFTTTIADLPYEVMENILCRLPMFDLALNVNRVSIEWNKIISNPEFVIWKKRYHKLLKGDNSAVLEIGKIMQKHGMSGIDNYLPELIKYISTYRPTTGDHIAFALRKHSKYAAAAQLLRERLPECIKNDVPNAWSVIVVIIFLSAKVSDIEEIFEVLLKGGSQCTALELLECMYCINCFLHTFKKMRYQDIWTGMHYRLYYALYLYENESSSTCGQLQSVFCNSRGQQSIMRYSSGDSSIRMTHEQMRICNHDVKDGQTIKIIAFAGTGKTTTLVRYTQLRPNLRFLLVVYNKSVVEHAKTKFPANVDCKTGHALAFRFVGRRYAAVKKLGGNVKVNEIVQNIQARKGENLYVQAKFVQDTLNNFMSSDHECITTAHVPDQRMEEDGKLHVITHETKMKLAEDAENLWAIMVDLKNPRMQLPHDGYLKLYQLQKPRFKGYDVIMIDEAQDLTPCIADLLLKQKQPKVLVGDPHQQIYSFRGAVNSMQSVQESHIFYLTQSFRFGPEISFVAATCLEFFKGEKRKVLVGNGKSGGIQGDTVGQVAIICRSNATLFNEAVKKCCYSDTDIRVAFAGGVHAFGFDMILDIYTLLLPPDDRLKSGRRINHPLVKCFQSFDELNKFALRTSDKELLSKIRIVKTYTNALPSLISKIRSKTISIMENADIVFSTAHKSKGLEFSSVRLTDDYITISGNLSPTIINQLPKDEINLLYVAVTRAKHRLVLSPTLHGLLNCAGEIMTLPVPSADLLTSSKPTLTCIKTQREFTPQSVTLFKKPVTLCTGVEKPGGPCCPQYVLEEIASLKHLLGAVKDERDDPNYQPPEREEDVADVAFDIHVEHQMLIDPIYL